MGYRPDLQWHPLCTDYSGMRSRIVSPIILAVLWLTSAAWCAECVPAPPEIPTLKVNVNEVHLTFNASKRSVGPVLDLKPSDFIVFDNGTPVRRLSGFRMRTDLPLDLRVLLDVSESVEPVVPAAEKALEEVKENELTATDRFSILEFGARFNTRFRQERGGGAEPDRAPGGVTSLYDNLYNALRSASADRFASAAFTRRAVLVISDGEDNSSWHRLNEVLDYAVRNDIAIYTVAVHSPHQSTNGETVLAQMSRQTGGQWYVANNAEEIAASIADAQRQLRTAYEVTFRPLNADAAGRYHKLTVRPVADRKLRFQHRAGYLTPAP